MAARGAVALALAVKRGEIKLADLPKSTKKKVEYVISSGSIDGMTGKEKTVDLPHQRTHGQLRKAHTV